MLLGLSGTITLARRLGSNVGEPVASAIVAEISPDRQIDRSLIFVEGPPTLKGMRIASFEVLVFALALGCSGTNEGSTGSAHGGTAGLGGSPASAGGAIGQSGSGASAAGAAGTQAEAGSGGSQSGNASGGNSGNSGSSGRSNGGATGASGASGGSGGCVQNLACKLSPPPSTGDIYQDCVDRINQFLTQCACLPALTRRTDGEACANQMAEYDATQNSAHAGAIAKICVPGGSQNECPGYASNNQVIGLCLQQMWDEGPPPMTPCTGTCYEDHGHFINMTDKNVMQVACGFYTTSSGKVWAVQNFSR